MLRYPAGASLGFMFVQSVSDPNGAESGSTAPRADEVPEKSPAREPTESSTATVAARRSPRKSLPPAPYRSSAIWHLLGEPTGGRVGILASSSISAEQELYNEGRIGPAFGGNSAARRRRSVAEDAPGLQRPHGRSHVRDRLPLRRAGRLVDARGRPGRQLRDDGGDPSRRARGDLLDDEVGRAQQRHGGVGGRRAHGPRGDGKDVLRRARGEANGRAREGDRRGNRQGERFARRNLGTRGPPVRDFRQHPGPQPTIALRATAHHLDGEREGHAEERAREDVGGPVHA